MTFRFVGSSLAVAILCAAGCGSGAMGTGTGTSVRETVGSSATAIQGGATDTSHNFAVVICGGANEQNGFACQILCSGALIAPNLVVSARHCVDKVTSDVIDCSTTTFGAPLFPANQYFISSDANIITEKIVNTHQVSQIMTPTPTEFCGNDLSLLILDDNVPTSEVPILATPEIWNPIDSPHYSAIETAIGYGVDAPDDAASNSAGVRRILENIDITCIPGDPALNCPPVAESGVSTNEFEAGNGPCEGDSGSSAYEQSNFNEGNWLSLGVLSRGGQKGDMCVGSVYTQLYPWQSLILSTEVTAAAQAASQGKSYPPPAWTTNPGDAATPDAALPDAALPQEASLPDSSAADSSAAAVRDSAPETSAPDSQVDPGSGGSGAPLGSSCTVNSNCSSDVCVSDTGDDGFVCSVACSAAVSCPVDYDCVQSFCFAVPTSQSSGGCSVGRVKTIGSSSERLAWAGLALAFAGTRRRRRARGNTRASKAVVPCVSVVSHGPHR